MRLNPNSSAWGSMMDTFVSSAWYPYQEMTYENYYTYGATPSYANFLFELQGRSQNQAQYFYQQIKPYDIAAFRNHWHHIEYYVKESPTATGIVRLWIDGSLTLEKVNMITQNSNTALDWYTIPLKLYTSCQADAMQYWIDDMEIWG